MKKARYLSQRPVVLLAALTVGLTFLQGVSFAGDSATVRENLKSIAKAIDGEQSTFTKKFTVILGNIDTGKWAWGRGNDLSEAERNAEEYCQGGNCDRLYYLIIFNDNDHPIDVHVFRPGEAYFGPRERLFTWHLDAHQRSRLLIRDAGHALVPKKIEMQIRAKGGRYNIGPMPIAKLNSKVINFNEGQALSMRFY